MMIAVVLSIAWACKGCVESNNQTHQLELKLQYGLIRAELDMNHKDCVQTKVYKPETQSKINIEK